MIAAVLCPATSTLNPVMSPVPSKTTTCISSPAPLPFCVFQADVLGAPSNLSENLQRLVINELSGIIVCNPPESASSFKRILSASLLIAVTWYSLLPASTEA
jgi:hypothetical protein